MKTLYLDCGMGAAGDMLTAALFELVPDKEEFVDKLNHVGIPGVEFICETSVKCGIKGTHITVKAGGEEESEVLHSHENGQHLHHDHVHSHDEEHTHHHSSMHAIEHIVENLNASEKVKNDIIAVYSIIAQAEIHVHGVTVSQIHFHEVGTMDAVADITAVCMLMEYLSPENVVVSPVNTGSGQVKCARGILPVPAPATAYILQGIPFYSGEIKSELCTPTGAALFKYFASDFGNMPVMKVSAIGYGMGKKDFESANCVRALLGEADKESDTIVELVCNLDDMTAEAIGFAQERFFAAGAVEVYTTPVQMKKSRPGTLLTVMCCEKNKDEIIRLIFRHTTTLGVREHISRRYTLSRSFDSVITEYGQVRKKISSGFGVTREKYEFEDLAHIARENNMSLADVKKMCGLR